MGALAEAECRGIIEALKLAKQRQLPLNGFGLSWSDDLNGCWNRNLDWTARVLAEIIAFTQAGGQINRALMLALNPTGMQKPQ